MSESRGRAHAAVPASRTAAVFRWAVIGVFLALCLVLLVQSFLPVLSGRAVPAPDSVLEGQDWLWHATVLLSLLATFAWMSRGLPLQTVLLGVAIITLIAAGITMLAVRTGIPFGSFKLQTLVDSEILEGLPWPVLVFWVAALLNCRGVAKLILRPWRRTSYYGFWVIGLTGLIMACLAGVCDPFATHIRHYWVWRADHTGLTWFGAPWLMFPSWALMTVLILAIATPVLIDKRRVPHGPDYVPLAIWSALMLVPGVALAVRGIIAPAIVCSGALLVFGGLAVWGGETKRTPGVKG